MQAKEYSNIVRHLEPISARIDRVENYDDMIQYIGIGVTTTSLEFKHLPKTDAEGRRGMIPLGASITYNLTEYAHIDGNGLSHVVTILVLYHVCNGEVFKFTNSINCNIDTAAHKWGLDGYR